MRGIKKRKGEAKKKGEKKRLTRKEGQAISRRKFLARTGGAMAAFSLSKLEDDW